MVGHLVPTHESTSSPIAPSARRAAAIERANRIKNVGFSAGSMASNIALTLRSWVANYFAPIERMCFGSMILGVRDRD